MADPVTINWRAHVRLTAVHAAYVVAAGGPCADRKTEQALLDIAAELNNRLLTASVDVPAFWRGLLRHEMSIAAAESAGSDRSTDPARVDRRGCEIALAEAGVSEMQLEPTARAVAYQLGECRLAIAARFPKLADQLRLRARPLTERWEAYGPGLLRGVAHKIWDGDPPRDFWPQRLDGLLVQPIRGGDGGYHEPSHLLWVEAVLTDVDPAVPEVLRVAWLVTQIAIDAHTREKSGERSARLPWNLATVPLVLAAAEDLELVRAGGLPIDVAMKLWQLGDGDIAAAVSEWWQQQHAATAAMPVALKTLDRMLDSTRRNDAAEPSSYR